MSEIEEMEDNAEEELKRKRTQLNVHVETKAQLLKIIEIATRYKKMKTDLEAEISKQIVQYVLQVEFDNNKLLVVCKNQICFFFRKFNCNSFANPRGSTCYPNCFISKNHLFFFRSAKIIHYLSDITYSNFLKLIWKQVEKLI